MKIPPNTSTLSGERLNRAAADVPPPNGGKSPLPPATFGKKNDGRSMKDEKIMNDASEYGQSGRPLAGREGRRCGTRLPQEILNELWTLYAETPMARVFGGSHEAHSAQGVQAGIVVALLAVLPAEQFRDVMIQWDVDAIKLTQLLHVAGGQRSLKVEGRRMNGN